MHVVRVRAHFENGTVCDERHRVSGGQFAAESVASGFVDDIRADDDGVVSWCVSVIAGTVDCEEEWETATDVSIAWGMMSARVVTSAYRSGGAQ